MTPTSLPLSCSAAASVWVTASSRSPADLSPSEERVARLTAEGRTNREVAETLFISTKTVEAHLARAYRKLGIRSRAELGACMARGGPAPDALDAAGRAVSS